MTFEVHKVVDEGKSGTKYIGQKVFFADTILGLMKAVESGIPAKLEEVDTRISTPFVFWSDDGGWVSYRFIYPAEEEKEKVTKYRPFSSSEELIDFYDKRVCPNPVKRPPYTMPLIWVKYNAEKSSTIQLITAFTNTGVEMGAEYMAWDYFFEKMVFLDNTPCGVKI